MKKTQKNLIQKNNHKKALNNFIKDGVAYSITSSMGEAYISAFALALGAGISIIGQLSAIPSLLSSTVQLYSSHMLNMFKNRKKIVLAGIIISVAVWLGIILLTLSSEQLALELLLTFIIIYSITNAVINPIWASWIGDFLSKRKLGAFFGKRASFVSAVSAIGSICAGIALSWFNGMNMAVWGFLFIFGIAAIARMMSAYYLSKIKNIKYTPKKRYIMPQHLHKKEHDKIRTFFKYSLLLFIVATIASPFFVVYKLNIVKISYLQFSFLILTSAFARYFSSRYWGGMIDKFNSKTVTLAGGITIGINPLIYAFFPNFYVFIIAELISGFGWSAYELGGFTYLMAHSNKYTRTEYVANYNFITGIARFIGTNIGIALIRRFDSIPFFGFGGIAAVMVISGVLRVLVTISFIPLLKDHGAKLKYEGKRIFALITEFPIERSTNQIFHHKHYSFHAIKMHWNNRKKK